MKTSATCLPADQIQALLAGDLSPAESSSAESHLADCSTCRSRMEAAIGDEHWWDDARRSLSTAMAEPRLDSQLREANHEGGLNATTTEQLLELLGPTDDPAMLGRIGGYEINGVLGQGGMGAVFKGFDKALNRYVAIKVLLPHLAVSGAARRRFAREAQAAAAVVDDHVMAIHGVNEWKSIPYFVMPYSRGVSLQKRIDDEGALELREILRVGMQTARGLAAAHAQGLVHRDVKPANIFLDEGVERVQLMDFGLARAVDDASLTRSGALAGTPQYMSPEQARAETVDARSDLFSLGAVLYAMSAGHAPFRAPSSYAVLKQISDEQPKPLREINPDTPLWMCELIKKLMSKRPEDRYQSAEYVAELLEGCLAHVQKPTVAQLPPALAPKRDSRFVPLAGAAAAIAGIALAALMFLLVAQQRQQLGTVLGRPVNENEINQKVELEDELRRLFVVPVEVKYLKEQGIDPEERLKQRIPHAGRRAVVLMFVRARVLHKHLYERYGGRVELSAFGPFAFDAHRKWLREREQAGDLSVTRSEHHKLVFQSPDSATNSILTEDKDAIRSAFDPQATNRFIEQMAAIPLESTRDPKQKLVGAVAGQPLYVHQRHLDSSDLPQILFHLIVPKLEASYLRQHPELAPTRAEIQSLGDILARNDVGILAAYRRSLSDVESAIRQAESSPAQLAKLREQKRVIESKIGRVDSRQGAESRAKQMKFQKHLYDTFGGGRAFRTPQGMVAFEAQKAWVQSREKLGDFQIPAPALRALFYGHWDGLSEKQDPQVLDADEALAYFAFRFDGKSYQPSTIVAASNQSRVGVERTQAESAKTAAKPVLRARRFPAEQVAGLIASIENATAAPDAAPGAVQSLRRITGLDFGDDFKRSQISWPQWWRREQLCIDNALEGERPFIVVGSVLDNAGEPVSGATIQAHVPFANSPTGRYMLGHTLTDLHGKYVLAIGLPVFAAKQSESPLPVSLSVLAPPKYISQSDDDARTLQLAIGDSALKASNKGETTKNKILRPNKPMAIKFELQLAVDKPKEGDHNPPTSQDTAASTPTPASRRPKPKPLPIGRPVDDVSPPDIAQGLSVPHSAWGPARKGLQAGLLLSDLVAHDDNGMYLTGTIVIKNVSDAPITFINRGGLVAPKLHELNGEPLRDSRRTGFGAMTSLHAGAQFARNTTLKRRVTLQPHEQYVLDRQCSVLIVKAHRNGRPASQLTTLDDWFVVQPGEYEVNCEFDLGATRYMQGGTLVAPVPGDWRGRLQTGKIQVSLFQKREGEQTYPELSDYTAAGTSLLYKTVKGRRQFTYAGRFQFGLNQGVLWVYDGAARGALTLSFEKTAEDRIQSRESKQAQIRCERTMFDTSDGDLKVYDLCTGRLLQRFVVARDELSKERKIQLSPAVAAEKPLADLQGDWVVDSYWFSADQNSFNDHRGQRWLLSVKGDQLRARVLIKQKTTADYPASTGVRSPFSFRLRSAKTDDSRLLRVIHGGDWTKYGKYQVEKGKQLRIVLGNDSPPKSVVAQGDVYHFEGHRPVSDADKELVATIERLESKRE